MYTQMGSFEWKFTNLMKITKNFRVLDTFFVMKDSDGWTDGMMADLTTTNFEIVRAMAILRGSKCSRLKLIKENGVEIAKVLPDLTKQEEVTDISYDLDQSIAILYSKNFKCGVNPYFLKYWVQFYKTTKLSNARRVRFTVSHDIKFMIGEEPLKPISVMVDGNRAGVIMPVRLQEEQK